MGIHLRLGGDDWGIIFTWDSFQPSTPAADVDRKAAAIDGTDRRTDGHPTVT